MKARLIFLFLIIILLVFFTNKKLEDYVVREIFLKNSVSVLNFGDVMFDRGVRNIIVNRKRDPFEYIKNQNSFFEKYDVVIANLEGPIVEMNRDECQQKIYNFQFASDTPSRLKSVGITMVNIANNHTYDCFLKGFTSTKTELARAGIEVIGDRLLEKSYIEKVINGKKVVFIGIDETVAPIPVSSFYSLVKELKLKNDYVIINIHWGTEYLLTENKNQEAIAHALIDNGADVIFGHHPHVIEPLKIYKGKPIFYSLGNFVFDQDFGDTTRGVGAGVSLEDGEIKIEIYPYIIKKFAPDFMGGEEKKKFCDTFFMEIKHTDCKLALSY